VQDLHHRGHAVRGAGRIPVVDEDRLVDIITRRDLVRTIVSG
jgi:CBS domain-containing protein